LSKPIYVVSPPPPVRTFLDPVDSVDSLSWARSQDWTQEPRARTGDRWGPHVQGHARLHDSRITVYGTGGPVPSFVCKQEGHTTPIYIRDERGHEGGIRTITPRENWVMHGGTAAVWDKAPHASRALALRAAQRGPTRGLASITLLWLTLPAKSAGGAADGLGEYQEEAMLAWMQAWAQGYYTQISPRRSAVEGATGSPGDAPQGIEPQEDIAIGPDEEHLDDRGPTDLPASATGQLPSAHAGGTVTSAAVPGPTDRPLCAQCHEPLEAPPRQPPVCCHACKRIVHLLCTRMARDGNVFCDDCVAAEAHYDYLEPQPPAESDSDDDQSGEPSPDSAMDATSSSGSPDLPAGATG
jgi:hypothetical protein